ncbi:TetR family transcriptional regulator [Aristophania vespae]|uniref:TetR family transcriptional regulator n=1 Tax=Aristophania vespae TaxID=2697033 RepID=A0A6P1NEQ5_9PROT|nr:TetR/AcrR family transcriptional regulator [Aristophania vespae]QHI95030.1 TetR family transcriptional regulator [Aristophania vespae]UMM64210.1 hypothetical protein DM15PD_12110 [Aristophania vespae]
MSPHAKTGNAAFIKHANESNSLGESTLLDFSEKNAGDELKRQNILDTTCTLLQSHGYRDISMDNIAKKAGMSKKTLYLYFPSKHALLEQLLLERLFSHLETSPDYEGDIETQLTNFCYDLARKILDTKRLGLLRAIIGETTRSATVQRLMTELFHLSGPKFGLQRWLAVQKEKGLLKITSPKDAADYFFGLTLGVPMLSQLAHCGPQRDQEDFSRFVKEGIHIFLAAYRVKD